MMIDPNILNIILGLITNGLGSLIALSSGKAGKLLIGEKFLTRWEHEKKALEPLLINALKRIAEQGEWNEVPREEIVSLFLVSPEVEEIVRQIYSTQLTQQGEGGLSSIRTIFSILFLQFVRAYPEVTFEEEQLVFSANQLFEALIYGCDSVLESAIHEGALTAHEAMTAFRHNIIYSEIHVLQKKLDFIISSRTISIKAILDFEQLYRQQVAKRHAAIIPPNFDSARKVPIDHLYVSPNFTAVQKNSQESASLKMERFLSSVYRAVLLGNPGAGKSTFALKLCYDLATRSSERLFAGRNNLLPILVVLRSYGAEKKIHRCSIFEFIETEARANYQLPSPPTGTFEYLLFNGRAMVIFDGLDELLDTSYRQEISNDIESFCHLYPSVPVLVTSREVGYEQAPLNEEMFEAFRLAPFDENQVQEYVEKWFRAAYAELRPKARLAKAEIFLKESQGVLDLRSNPLMLSLMCNIYRGENYIPKNRPDIYDKCATMLFDRWDRNRDIHIALPLEAHISPAMKYLAYWIYSHERLRAGVTETKLVEKTTDYLRQKRFEDRDEAERAARAFIEFCRGRGWVFTDIGTTKEGERLYQFTHQTFLEYFTAAYLVRTHPTPDRLLDIILPKIVKGEWDSVASLTFQIQNKNAEDAGDELLSALLVHSKYSEGEEVLKLLLFAVRCMAFLVPSPKVIRSIVQACIEYVAGWGIALFNREDTFSILNESALRELLVLLHSALHENRATINDALEHLLRERFQSEYEPEVLLALEMSVMTSIRIDHIFDHCPDRVKALSPTSLLVCNRAFFHGMVSLSDCIKWHGISMIFCICSHLMDQQAYFLPPSSLLLKDVFQFDGSQPLRYLEALKQVGTLAISYPLPWIKQLQVGACLPAFSYQLFDTILAPSREPLEMPGILDPDILFSTLVLCALYLEAQDLAEQSVYLNLIKTSVHPVLKMICWILVARFDLTISDQIQAELDACGFNQEQQHFIGQWVRGDISFVEQKLEEKVYS